MKVKQPEGMSTAAMVASTSAIFESLGAKLAVEPDADLTRYRRGVPLRIEAMEELRDGSIIWITYRAAGERAYRANGAYRIRAILAFEGKRVGWEFEDGSSFAGGIHPNVDLWAIDEDDDGGVTTAWQAIEKKARRRQK